MYPVIIQVKSSSIWCRYLLCLLHSLRGKYSKDCLDRDLSPKSLVCLFIAQVSQTSNWLSMLWKWDIVLWISIYQSVPLTVDWSAVLALKMGLSPDIVVVCDGFRYIEQGESNVLWPWVKSVFLKFSFLLSKSCLFSSYHIFVFHWCNRKHIASCNVFVFRPF